MFLVSIVRKLTVGHANGYPSALDRTSAGLPMNFLHLEDNDSDAEIVARLVGREWPGCVIKRLWKRRNNPCNWLTSAFSSFLGSPMMARCGSALFRATSCAGGSIEGAPVNRFPTRNVALSDPLVKSYRYG